MHLLAARLVLADADRDVVLLVDRIDDLLDVRLHRLRGDVVGLVVGHLLFAAAGGFGDGAVHRAGHVVGVEDHLAVDVAGGAADGLDQGGLGAQEAFLVGVENGDEATFGNVEALDRKSVV